MKRTVLVDGREPATRILSARVVAGRVVVVAAAAALAAGCGSAAGQRAGQSMQPRPLSASASPAAPVTAPASESAAPSATPVPATGTQASPDAVVAGFFDAVNKRDWQRAWRLGGRNLSPSYHAMVAGFAGTAQDNVTITGTRGGTVSVLLVAVQTSGRARTYHGAYQVSGGVITAGRQALRSNGPREPARFSALAGVWQGHDRDLTISARGLGISTFRVFNYCSDSQPPPCDTLAGNSIYPGGVTVFQLTSLHGNRAKGSIQDGSTSARSGPATVTFHPATDSITLAAGKQDVSNTYCGSHSPAGFCGA
jgi:hypothetical protein